MLVLLLNFQVENKPADTNFNILHAYIMSTPLSVVIITKNEEKNIGRCLESVLPVADEIVVVDSLSDDNTRNICLQYGARFIEQPFLGYIQQKNFALSQASHAFVLSLDADEALDAQLTQSILSVKQQAVPAIAYKMNRLTNFCGRWIRHGRWYPDRKVRLFNKGQAKWGGENPHDKIILANEVQAVQLKGDILHYSYYTIEEYLSQINKFSTIQAEGLYKRGKKANAVKIYLNPVVAFIRAYLFGAGFLDGYRGLIIAYGIAYTTLLKYGKLKLMNGQSNRQESVKPS